MSGSNGANIAPSLPANEVLAKETRDLREAVKAIEDWAEILSTESCAEVRMQMITNIQNQTQRMNSILDAVTAYLNGHPR